MRDTPPERGDPEPGECLFRPSELFVERGAEEHPLGARLLSQYLKADVPIRWVVDHNRIPELRELPDAEFAHKKKVLVLGVRKSLRLVPNRLSADYIVPFTSSGCPAMCLYCYLTCTFFSNAYLRLFVNRERMWDTLERRARRAGIEHQRGHEGGEVVFEIGSNSDMLVDESLTGNLRWVIPRFGRLPYGRLTFATKFAAVDRLLDLEHGGRTRVRVSINPAEIIRRVELGTARLPERLEAANRLHAAGYEVGLNLAPVILGEDWQAAYRELLDEAVETLAPDLRRVMFFEIIFMTYGLATRDINQAAFPRLTGFHRPELMRPKGRGKTCYADPLRIEAERWLRHEIGRRFPEARVAYVC